MDESEEWDPPQFWPRAESETMNRALRLLCAERERKEIKCKIETGKAEENPIISPLLSLVAGLHGS